MAADAGTLATIAAIIPAFSAAMLYFRIQRELSMESQGEIIWIPWSDRLLISATMLSIFLAILPLLFLTDLRLPAAAVGSSTILVAGYFPAILSHYRIWFRRPYLVWGTPRVKELYENPEPAERVWVYLAIFLALSVFIARLVLPVTRVTSV